jgi:hypothetical protein
VISGGAGCDHLSAFSYQANSVPSMLSARFEQIAVLKNSDTDAPVEKELREKGGGFVDRRHWNFEPIALLIGIKRFHDLMSQSVHVRRSENSGKPIMALLVLILTFWPIFGRTACLTQ